LIYFECTCGNSICTCEEKIKLSKKNSSDQIDNHAIGSDDKINLNENNTSNFKKPAFQKQLSISDNIAVSANDFNVSEGEISIISEIEETLG